MEKKEIVIILIIIAMCLITPVINAESTINDNTKNQLRIADKTGDWGYPNPYLAYARGPGYMRMHFIFDTLVWKNETTQYIPLLAEKWEYLSDEDAYVFHLNKNAKWHDMEPLTAEDVVFTIEYMKEHPYGWVILDSVDRGEVLDEHTVKIHMSSPYAPFMEDIGGSMPILPEHIWKDVENPMDFTDETAFIGSGPYTYVDFSKEHGTYQYEAFGEYYLGKPIIDKLIYVKTGDPQMTLQRGEADFTSIKSDFVEQIKEDGFVVIKGPHYWNKKLMINHNIEPLDNIIFRQALAHAINQDEFVDKSLRGHGKPASYGLISSESVWISPNVPDYPYDPDKAIELITSLGYELKDGVFTKNGKTLELQILVSMISTGGEGTPDRDGEIIMNQLEKVGIKVDLTSLDTKIVDTKVINWDFDLAISGHGAIGGDPKILHEKTLQVPGVKPNPNCARYNKSEELNKLLDDVMHEMDPEKRKEAVFEAQNVYARELPAISIYYPTWYNAYDPDTGVEWFETIGGVSKGIPIPQNKLALIGSSAAKEGKEITDVTSIPVENETQGSPLMPFLAVIALLLAFMAIRIKR
ncbi:MAG: peptide-binding protein [ANME-2 cluster archaeon]|nr:peptide-binding protein [ANME-2 cluster archaeon]MBC2702112.1 peptide-binding protein [ANME-2 cluster archaeon]MBC2706776.1 peptide-binding protein [ANME-2 cluster archaeon]MBC2747646.1 peptide-binding protein [ANME-2 cluster archaeon]